MSKYTRSAKGQDCQVRIPGVCNWDPDTTVFAHLNGGGMGKKQYDIHGAYCCSDCHDVIDGRKPCRTEKIYIEKWHLEGMVRTQQLMIEQGILKL